MKLHLLHNLIEWPFLIWRTLLSSLLRCIIAFSILFSQTPVIYAYQDITAIWANNGEDKVTRDELRATHGNKVTNSVWDGSKISIFGARNEVVAFNVVLEAGSHDATSVSVSFDTLIGPNNAIISSIPATGNGVFDWTQRQIELFYVRYLQIKGLSRVSYELYDERHIPQRFRRPWTGNGYGSGTWLDRPDHDKYYPDIAVPLELVPTFKIAHGTNQSIWVDVYVPKTAPAGNYIGNLVVKERGSVVGSLPVQLKVYNFSLPDLPTTKTMMYISSNNINQRFFGSTYVGFGTAAGDRASLIRDRYFMVAHRHKISLTGGDYNVDDCKSTADQPCPEWKPRLDGSLFTAAHGYDGPGTNTGNNIYAITGWTWSKGTQADMNLHTDAWATWFNTNAPSTDYFLYLIDESPDTAQIETWSQMILNNPGPGHAVKSMATIKLPTAAAQCPSLDIPTSTMGVGIPSVWQPLVTQYTTDARKRFYMYNGTRPASGSTAIEDDGVALRERAWGQYKKGIQRWFFWEATYYDNFQGSMGLTNVFETAKTFGGTNSIDPVIGETSWNYGNGDGVLFYPGTDQIYPDDSYGVDGPFASLRMKYWRRGIQDADYLSLASGVDAATTQNVVNQMIPKVLWEYGVTDPSDPSYVRTDISWSNNPDVWEAARLKLANIISGQVTGNEVNGLPAPTLNLPSVLPVTAQISAGYPSGYNIVAYEWSFVPNAPMTASYGYPAASLAKASGPEFKTPNATAHLAPMNLYPGVYQISVMAIDANNNVSPPALANVTLVFSDLSSLRVFPNPWRSDRHSGTPVTFDGLTANTTVKIFTTSGHLARSFPPANSSLSWDLTNNSGAKVASGIYLYLVQTPAGETARGQVTVIK